MVETGPAADRLRDRDPTTAGIILSMLFETGSSFCQYPRTAFFFGTTWSPKFGGGSQLGMLPLLGTLYISAIALAVSVPIGLFAAIYMSEYAWPGCMRGVVKLLIEVLAGIPTIVYGLFALITVGLMLRDWSRSRWAWAPGVVGDDGGLVMGVMLIPFVSSLSG